MGKMAVMIPTCMADIAQSYMAQARSSGRWRPRRSSKRVVRMSRRRVAEAGRWRKGSQRALTSRVRRGTLGRLMPVELPTQGPTDMKILALVAAGVLAVAGPLASQQASVARLVVSPAHPEVVAGDSLRLTAQALDANGTPVPDATITFQKKGLQGASVEADGLFRAGARGTMQVVVSAIVPGSKPVIEEVTVRMLPGPATRIEIGAHPELLVPGQRFQLGAQVLTASGELRDDAVA